MAGKCQQKLSNDWMTGSRTRVRLRPGEGDSGTIKDTEMLGRWSLQSVFKRAELKC